jgi:hypothetical protein
MEYWPMSFTLNEVTNITNMIPKGTVFVIISPSGKNCDFSEFLLEIYKAHDIIIVIVDSDEDTAADYGEIPVFGSLDELIDVTPEIVGDCCLMLVNCDINCEEDMVAINKLKATYIFSVCDLTANAAGSSAFHNWMATNVTERPLMGICGYIGDPEFSSITMRTAYYESKRDLKYKNMASCSKGFDYDGTMIDICIVLMENISVSTDFVAVNELEPTATTTMVDSNSIPMDWLVFGSGISIKNDLGLQAYEL